MRIVGKIGAIKLRTHIEEWDDRAKQNRVVVQGINLLFEQGTMTDHEVEEGLDKLGPFKGLPMYEDGVTSLSPRSRLRIIDTDEVAKAEHWDAETKAWVDGAVFEHPDYGREFVVVSAQLVPAPWPNYPKLVVHGRRTIDHVVAQIVEKVKEDGYDPKVVAAYEAANLNRGEVIAAMDALADTDDDLVPAAARSVEELIVEA